MFDQTNQTETQAPVTEQAAETEVSENSSALQSENAEAAEKDNGPVMPKSLFGEDEDGQDADPDSAEKPSEAVEESGQTQQKKPATLRVKYNGKQQDISLDDAVVLAQKGMNYDHILKERDALKEQDTKYKRGMDVLDRYAARNNMSRDEYVQYLEKVEQQTAIEAEIESMAQKYPDSNPELLEEIAKIKANQREREAKEDIARQEAQQREARIAPWRDFFAKFPSVKVDTLPEQVYNDINTGMPPVEAYQKYRIAELESKLSAVEKIRENKSRSIGSARGDGREAGRDPFLEGFLST